MIDDVLISTQDRVGRIRLNRPKAIHALTTQMCEVMSQALLRWMLDDSVEAVVIDHAEGRGFCAGGDVVMLARSGKTDADEAKRFFFAEYRLNHLLFAYPKPTVAIMDGITMGGRRRHFTAVRFPHRDGEHALCDARNQHRPVPGRWRRLGTCRACPAASANSWR